MLKPAAIAVALAATPLAGGGISAHPHVWATVQTEVEVNAKHQVVALHHTWSFDEEYSRVALDSLSDQPNGSYTPENLKSLADVNMEELQKFGYFTYTALQSKKLEYGEVKTYNLEYRNKVLILHFDLPLKAPVTLGSGEPLSFAVYDPSYFIDFGLDETLPVTLTKGSPSTCKVEVKNPEPPKETTIAQAAQAAASEMPSAFGAIYAKHVNVACGMAPKS